MIELSQKYEGPRITGRPRRPEKLVIFARAAGDIPADARLCRYF
jgi:hypothetical protein